MIGSKVALPAFITLTLLDGSKIHVEANRPNISILRPGHGQCAKAHATAIIAAGKSLCVLETWEEIDKLVKDNEAH